MTTAFFRPVILYLILMVGLRLMGKRQIGELEVSELVLTLIISDLAAVPMQDFGIPLVNGVFYTDVNAQVLVIAAAAAYLVVAVVFRASASS